MKMHNFMKHANYDKIFKVIIGVIATVMVLSGCGDNSKTKEAASSEEKENIVACEWIEPSEENNHKNLFKVTYDGKTLMVPRGMVSQFDCKFNRLFFDVNTESPAFNKRVHSSDNADRLVRILFEINERTVPFQDFYPLFVSLKNKARFDETYQDQRYAGMIGYKRNDRRESYWYLVKEGFLRKPPPTPLAIYCSGDQDMGVDLISRKGECRFNIVIDDLLRVQIRFNKPLLKDFPLFYEKVIEFIESIRVQR